MKLTGTEDRRVQRTIKSLKKAYMDLLEEKENDRITVTELADRAMVNKKTFYCYYSSLDDLRLEMVEETVDLYGERIRVYDFNDYKDIVREFYEYFCDKEAFLCKVIAREGANFFYERTEQLINAEEKPGFVKAKSINDTQRHLILVYLINCLLSMFERWYTEGRKIPMKDAIEMTADLIENGAGVWLN